MTLFAPGFGDVAKNVTFQVCPCVDRIEEKDFTVGGKKNCNCVCICICMCICVCICVDDVRQNSGGRFYRGGLYNKPIEVAEKVL